MAIDPRHIVEVLDAHLAGSAEEADHQRRMRDWALRLPAPHSRHQTEAHFTASALVVDPAGRRACLVHHAKLNKWLQPGGHLEESDASLAEAALREAREETGLAVRLHPRCAGPLDVDVHWIPPRKTEEGHFHLDVRYLLCAEDAAPVVSEESSAVCWADWPQAQRLAGDDSVQRLLSKARALIDTAEG